jgi:zinc/manganese transport system substrate-binding protein
MPRRVTTALVASAFMLASAVGCSASTARPGVVSLVASTNVYANIASQVVGQVRSVEITSVISNPNQDPHTYEASARTELALSKAGIVVENGGGYDDFMSRMLAATHNHRADVLDVVTLSGKKATDDRDFNEHVWYDFATVRRLTTALVSALSSAQPAHRAAFRANATAFLARLARLSAVEASIKTAHGGAPVAITEPVPLYLLQACGLVDRTPAAFSAAVENATDVSVRVLQQTLHLFSAKAVTLLAYNDQAVDPETAQVLAAAKANHIPIVPVTETLPAGQSYLSWMAANLRAVQAALG